MKVKAIKAGYYKLKRRKEGDVFFLNSEKDFSKLWMEVVGAEKEEKAKVSKPKAKPVSKAKDEEVI